MLLSAEAARGDCAEGDRHWLCPLGHKAYHPPYSYCSTSTGGIRVKYARRRHSKSIPGFEMDDTLATTKDPGNSPSNQGSRSVPQYGSGRIDNTGYVQTLYILVFRGHPRDTESARTMDFCIIANDNNKSNTTYRLEGDHGSYKLITTTGLGAPRSRPHFVRQLHVATVPVVSHEDTKLHDLVGGIAVNNENPEWTRWTWVDNVLCALSAAGIISLEEGTGVLDATIGCVSSAPYPE
ncbi:hypothetical protein SUNI508_13538 [Seiridium unicorne]|uniref:Uncharacterized protein n=1 Tax=Seiridium unicorne TaxID=138068 RepID=A0ABR2VDJ3_9PEZI